MYVPAVADCILVWRFGDAPPELQALSQNGGDEDYVMYVPAGDRYALGRIVEFLVEHYQSPFGVCDTDVYEYADGSVIYIGCHA